MIRRLVTASLIISSIFLVSCKEKINEFAPAYSSIYVADKDKLESAIVEEFDNTTYKENDLNTYINSEIERYNSNKGINAVSLKSISTVNGKAKINFAYNSAETLLDYAIYSQDDSINLESFEILTMDEALNKDFSSYIPDNLKGKSSFKVIYSDGSADFVTATKIEAVAGEGIEKISDYEFKALAGKNIAIIK